MTRSKKMYDVKNKNPKGRNDADVSHNRSSLSTKGLWIHRGARAVNNPARWMLRRDFFNAALSNTFSSTSTNMHAVLT